ncbi:MAG: hypothetical protein K2G37_00750 [Clostridia bacterium]|nr:hypothetical protein [Clostridia bacterium]MDE7328828.1 hypothetical protein [Clostridia bacterium]
MNIEIIIAIVSAGIAFITSVANFTYSLIQGRKDRLQKVVLDNRIKYMNEIRESFSNFIALANVEAITYAQNNSEVMKIYSTNLFNGYGKIKTYLKPFYKIENNLLTLLDNLYYGILSTLNGSKTDKDYIDKLRKEFSDEYLKYDWAYWKYIQSQREGHFKDSDEDFDKIYYDLVEKINNNSF